MNDKTSNYYLMIPANLKRDKSISAIAKLIYGEIHSLTKVKGYCWARNKYFAELYEIDEKTVQRCISMLKEAHYIKTKINFVLDTKEVESRYIYINDLLLLENKLPWNATSHPGDKIVPTWGRADTHLGTCRYPGGYDFVQDNNNNNKNSESAGDTRAERDTRIDPNFVVDDEIKKFRDWKYPDISDAQLNDARDRFYNHFHSAPGRFGIKRNWNSAFKNWITTDYDNGRFFKNKYGSGVSLNGATFKEPCRQCSRHTEFPDELTPCHKHQTDKLKTWTKKETTKQ